MKNAVLLNLCIATAKVGHEDRIIKMVADNGSNMVKGWQSLDIFSNLQQLVAAILQRCTRNCTTIH
jgi:hypothetical protein